MTPGFTVTVAGPTVTLAATPSPLVAHARRGPLAVAVMGRLFDHPADPAGAALTAYRDRGPAGLDDLDGDFALVLWDGRTGTLHAARDPMGGYPLYHAGTPAGLAVGTGLGPVVQAHGRRELDAEYFADFLAAAGQRNDAPGDRTPYRGVSRLPAGHALAARGDAVTVRRFWDWADAARDPGPDPAAAVADALAAAVRRRAVGPVAAHLSGGMDSTAVALLADRHAAGPVHTLSMVYHRLPKLAGEREYVEAGADELRHAAAVRLPGDDLLDYDGVADCPPHDEPYAGLWRVQMDRHLTDTAARLGATTILTGVGADPLFDRHPHHLRDLLGRGRLPAAWAEAGRWASALNCNRWQLVREFGLRRGENPPAPPGWLRPDFARRFDLPGRTRRALAGVYGTGPAAERGVALSALATEAGDPVRWLAAAPHGVHIAHPFHDRRVVGLALGAMAQRPPRPGRQKPLLADACRGLLPPLITGRRAKGHFDELYYRGLARNRAGLDRLIRAAGPAAGEFLDAGGLARGLEEASLGGKSGRALLGLELSVAAVYWLANAGRWHAAPLAGELVSWAGAGGAVSAAA